jgi:hypothetical protein
MKDAKGALVADAAGQPRSTAFQEDTGNSDDVPF